MRHRLLTAASIFSLMLLGSACDLLDEPCPEGYWRPRAMHECEPVPTFDGGTDAGVDAAVVMDASPGDDAATDAQVGDGGGPADAAADDGSVAADGSVSDGGATDGGDAG